MLVGKTGCGKTTLSQAIQGLELHYRKTQAVSYQGSIIDTPGEFVENRRYYSALLASATTCDVVCLVQDGTARNSIFPPKFASMFTKKVIGAVSKVDREDCNLERAQKFLRWAGASEIVLLSSYTRAGLEKFEQYLLG
jgi:ethanolamine utilization protein EutP